MLDDSSVYFEYDMTNIMLVSAWWYTVVDMMMDVITQDGLTHQTRLPSKSYTGFNCLQHSLGLMDLALAHMHPSATM